MKTTYIIIGLILLLLAYAMSLISVPWIEWRGNLVRVPVPILISLTPVAYLFGCIGIIAIIFGLTENPAIRVSLSFLSVLACLALITGLLTLEKLQQLLRQIKLTWSLKI